MNSNAGTNPVTPIRKYELGQPIIRREQRIALERIHLAVAQSWSDAMAEELPHDSALEFEGLDFATFSSVLLDQNPCAQIALFSIGSAPISGFLMMTGALAKFLVSNRLGLKAAPQAAVPFTRIEASVARETTRRILTRLGDAYVAANLGAIGNIRQCENLDDSFVFAPEESIALLKFRIGAASDDLSMLIGLGSGIVSSMAEHQPRLVAPSNGREAIVSVVRRLPIEVDVVLGSWKVPLNELLRLREGEKIILPDGEDAWLSAGGVRIRSANVEVIGNRAGIEIRGRIAAR